MFPYIYSPIAVADVQFSTSIIFLSFTMFQTHQAQRFMLSYCNCLACGHTFVTHHHLKNIFDKTVGKNSVKLNRNLIEMILKIFCAQIMFGFWSVKKHGCCYQKYITEIWLYLFYIATKKLWSCLSSMSISSCRHLVFVQ